MYYCQYSFRMIPYGCLSTGLNVGMIEVVRNAKTVMHILKQDIRSAMMVRSKELHNWIKEKAKAQEGFVTIHYWLHYV